MENLRPPEPLSDTHTLENFECSEPSLDQWLKKKALKNQTNGASRTFVTTDEQSNVMGYYCLAAGAISQNEVPKNMRRNMPNPLPILVLGRLAMSQDHQDQGLGSALLRDAMLRAVSLSHETGIFAILVHALSKEAKKFYLSRGFVESPIQPMTLMMTLKTIRRVLVE